MRKDILTKLIFNILKIYIKPKTIYPFLHERMKIKKVEKLVANLHNKNKYGIHIRNLKQALNHGLVFKNVIELLSLIKKQK